MTVETQQTPGDDQQADPGSEPTPPQSTPEPPPSWISRVHTAMTTPITLPWWTVYVLAAVVPFVLAFGFWSRWGAAQWGAAATWLSGMSTLAAVVVALRQTAVARRSAEAAKVDAAAAKVDADARVEREISAYRERVEAQLSKSDELHERRAHAEHLAAQRSELVILWPHLDAMQLAASHLPLGAGYTRDVHREWSDQRVAAKLAVHRALLFVSDDEVRVAIHDLFQAIEMVADHAKSTAGVLTEEAAETAKHVRGMRITGMRAARSALRAKVSARLNEFAPEDVKREADAWSTPTTVDDI
ncbi:hypothetical protein ACWDUD_28425 [Rhodococcus sp. NPDC003382]